MSATFRTITTDDWARSILHARERRRSWVKRIAPGMAAAAKARAEAAKSFSPADQGPAFHAGSVDAETTEAATGKPINAAGSGTRERSAATEAAEAGGVSNIINP